MTYSVFTMFGALAEDRVDILKTMLDSINGRRDRIEFLEESAKLAHVGEDGVGWASATEEAFQDYKAACFVAGLDWRIDKRVDGGKLKQRTVWHYSVKAETVFHFADDGTRLFSAEEIETALAAAGPHGLMERLSNDASRYDVVALVLPKSAFERESMTTRVASFLRRAN